MSSEIVEDSSRFRVVILTLRCHCHEARGPLQQSHAQMRLQLAHQLADRCVGNVEGIGRSGEIAGLDDSSEGAHCLELIHLSIIHRGA
jgi:hypothetical protein